MAGYSGTASFEFEVERYKNKLTGELLMSESEDINNLHEYEVILLNVEGRSYYQPAKTSGLPENCYPAEGDTEIKSITGPDGSDWSLLISDKERESILSMIEDQSQEYDGPDPDVDFDYDDIHELDDISYGMDDF